MTFGAYLLVAAIQWIVLVQFGPGYETDALFTSLIAVPRTFANASTGFLIEWLGYTSFFLLCTALAVPGMLMLLKAAPWRE